VNRNLRRVGIALLSHGWRKLRGAVEPTDPMVLKSISIR
jgi:hypothetical protein